MRRNILLLPLVTAVFTLTGCAGARFPEVCQTAVPTVKNCFSAQGTHNSYSIGPFVIYSGVF